LAIKERLKTKKAPGVLGRPGLRLVRCLAKNRLCTTSGPTAPVGKAKPEVIQIRVHRCLYCRQKLPF
jgi:hypothetical protein